MRKIVCTLALAFLSVTTFAQTSAHRFSVSLGFGPQDYKGELGNGFKDNSAYDVWRGAAVLHATYYLNRSFDIGLLGTSGDFGFCQPDEIANTPVDDDDQCPGCEGRVGLGNLTAHLDAVGLFGKYKFANGYIMKATSRLQPYIYAGAAYNNVTDPMHMNCVKTGSYLSINGGLGVKFYITKRLSVGYNMGISYMNRDDLDFMSHDNTNDMIMQNSIMVGFDL